MALETFSLHQLPAGGGDATLGRPNPISSTLRKVRPMSYIFTPPAVAYDVKLTPEGLQDFLAGGRNPGSRKIGKTVTIIRPLQDRDEVQIWLYNTHIASVYLDGPSLLWISPEINNHGSQATTWWTQKAISDNKLPGYVAREKGAYAVAGRTYTK